MLGSTPDQDQNLVGNFKVTNLPRIWLDFHEQTKQKGKAKRNSKIDEVQKLKCMARSGSTYLEEALTKRYASR